MRMAHYSKDIHMLRASVSGFEELVNPRVMDSRARCGKLSGEQTVSPIMTISSLKRLFRHGQAWFGRQVMSSPIPSPNHGIIGIKE